jgi:hypothetical protein
MGDLVVAVPTRRTSAEVRATLEAAIDRELPPGFLQHRWEGDVLHVWGLGASGTVALEGTQLVARARLGPPASFMQPLVEQRLAAALRAVA